MSPRPTSLKQHRAVLQADLDLGNYERFLDITLTRDHNITTGKVRFTRLRVVGHNFRNRITLSRCILKSSSASAAEIIWARLYKSFPT